MVNELSVVIPCVSALEPLPEFIDQLAGYLMENPSDMDLIIVTNEHAQSPEKIIEYVRKKYPWLRFVILRRSGKTRLYGALARFGIAYSTSRYVVLVSPYGEDDISVIPKMLRKIREGAQVIQATRYTSEEDIHRVPWEFRLYQSVYRIGTRVCLGLRVTDSTYGFKMFDRPFILALGLTQNGYSICPEITIKSLLAGGKVEYIPSTMRISPHNKDFKLYREGLGYLWLLLRGVVHRLGILWF